MKKRILIVDDESVILTELEEYLVSMGFDVVGRANSGEKAVESASNLLPDLIMMDIKMPGLMDGIDAAIKITEERKIPIIFLTAYADDELIKRAKQIGPFGYIIKPFSDVQIEAAIEIALYKKDMEEKLEKANDELEEKIKERTLELEEVNTALRVMLKKRDEEKIETGDNIVANMKALIFPYLDKLKAAANLTDRQKEYVGIIEKNIDNIISPFVQGVSSKYNTLSPLEIQIANLIVQGKRTKEIAEILSLSMKTVEYYRKNIRTKTGIKNKKINLRTHLSTILG